jgi:hypothetical protein
VGGHREGVEVAALIPRPSGGGADGRGGQEASGVGGGALGVLLARKKGRGEKDLGQRRSMPFNGGGSSGEEQWGGAGVGVVPRGGGGRGGPGAVPGRRCRPAAARPQRERVGSACMHGWRQTGEARVTDKWARGHSN